MCKKVPVDITTSSSSLDRGDRKERLGGANAEETIARPTLRKDVVNRVFKIRYFHK